MSRRYVRSESTTSVASSEDLDFAKEQLKNNNLVSLMNVLLIVLAMCKVCWSFRVQLDDNNLVCVVADSKLR